MREDEVAQLFCLWAKEKGDEGLWNSREKVTPGAAALGKGKGILWRHCEGL